MSTDRRQFVAGLVALPVAALVPELPATGGTFEVTGSLTCYFDNPELLRQWQNRAVHHFNCRCVLVEQPYSHILDAYSYLKGAVSSGT